MRRAVAIAVVVTLSGLSGCADDSGGPTVAPPPADAATDARPPAPSKPGPISFDSCQVRPPSCVHSLVVVQLHAGAGEPEPFPVAGAGPVSDGRHEVHPLNE